MGAGRPPILTCTWSSEVGNGLVATTVSAARFELLENVSSSPGAIPAVNGAQLAALTIPCGFRNTPVGAMAGAGPYRSAGAHRIARQRGAVGCAGSQRVRIQVSGIGGSRRIKQVLDALMLHNGLRVERRQVQRSIERVQVSKI